MAAKLEIQNPNLETISKLESEMAERLRTAMVWSFEFAAFIFVSDLKAALKFIEEMR
jgi:hypothetical protein